MSDKPTKAQKVAAAQKKQDKAYQKALKEYKKNGPDPSPPTSSRGVFR